MYADVTLNSLAVRPRVSRIVWQQGRVQLDSDANEQTAALLYYLRALGEDVIGVHAGIGPSFRISLDGQNIRIAYGHYYVDGIRCDNLPANFNLFTAAVPAAPWLSFKAQPDLPFLGSPNDPDFAKQDKPLVYLDVWERHISSAQDDSIREVALGNSADTSGRAQIVWQVRTLVPDETKLKSVIDLVTKFVAAQKGGQPTVPLTFLSDVDAEYLALNMYLRSSALLTAKAGTTADTNPCVISPDARYRGTENQLFRVEIHKGDPDPAFKWAYDAGSTVFPIKDIQGSKIIVESLGRDDRTTLTDKHWVEIVDDDATLLMHPRPLRKVTLVDRTRMEVTVDGDPLNEPGEAAVDLKRVLAGRPILRRWEDKPQTIKLTADPIKLRAGIEIQFSSVTMPIGGFRTGDYWLIPARTATGELIWPRDPVTKDPLPQPPHGVEHHYAPLAQVDGTQVRDLRRVFEPIRVVPPPQPAGGSGTTNTNNIIATQSVESVAAATPPAKTARKKKG